jgi:hypothetical protein
VPPPEDIPLVDDYDLPETTYPDDVLDTGEGVSAGTIAMWGGAALLILGGLGYVIYDWMKGKQPAAAPGPLPPTSTPMAGPTANPFDKPWRATVKFSGYHPYVDFAKLVNNLGTIMDGEWVTGMIPWKAGWQEETYAFGSREEASDFVRHAEQALKKYGAKKILSTVEYTDV